MLRLGVICTVLLQLLSWPCAAARSDAGETAFDYDRALQSSQDALGRQLRNHTFTDAESGQQVSLKQLRGKPLVLSLVYTSCHQICPMTTRHLAGVVDKARDALGADSFNVAVIGFDPPVDTASAMRYFADRQGVSGRGWLLFSADRRTIEELTADLGFQYFSSANGFDHLIQASVIDAQGRVYRQVYGQVFETPLLVDPLIELVLGRAPPGQTPLQNLVARVRLFCTTYDPVRDGYYFDYSLFLGLLIGGSIIVFGAGAIWRELNKQRRL